MRSKSLYDTIGKGYATQRVPDPRIAAQIHSALGDAKTVVNVGAGAGSYEPTDRFVVAIEPSTTMIQQRQRGAAPAVQAAAESLPIRDHAVSAAMAILTMHHWTNPVAGLNELGRIARDRVAILTWDPAGPEFWLTQHYFPAMVVRDRSRFPSISQMASILGSVRVEAVPIPGDCIDGLLGAYWCRPHSYLDPDVRAGMSGFAGIDGEAEGLSRLEADLASGEWARRFGSLCDRSHLDIGYRLVTATMQ
jgi:SAM-dependent methyltransferase